MPKIHKLEGGKIVRDEKNFGQTYKNYMNGHLVMKFK